MMPRLLPWEYGVRNLFRRPWRTGLTLCALGIVVLLVLVAVGFAGGLEHSLAASGDPAVVLVYGMGMGENLEYSSIRASTADLLAASLPPIARRYRTSYVSPELYLATRIATPKTPPATGLVRGVTPAAFPVRSLVQITSGVWPGPGEVMAGRLATAKLGCSPDQLAPGETVVFEGRRWRVSGSFAAGGSVFESELWCRLEDFQQALRRQDLSLVAMKLVPGGDFGAVDLFCKQRLDLELQASRETEYFRALNRHYGPVRMLAWLVAWLVAGAGVLAALNTMYAAVVGRIRELAALQTLGFSRRAIAVSLIQESVLLAAGGTLLAATIGATLLDGTSIRFTMGAFRLETGGPALLVAAAVGLLVGVVGALPPAIRAMRLPIVEALRSM